MPKIRLPDGSVKSFDGPVTVAEIAQAIGAGLPHCVQNFLPVGISDAQLVHCMAIPKALPASTDQSGVASFSSALRRPEYQISHAALKKLLHRNGAV